MNRNGWYEIAHRRKLLAAHSKVATKKEGLIKEFISLTKSSDYICSPNAYKVELAKSSIRSCLRFSSEAMDFTKILVRDILETKPEYSKYWVTMPYILFHLPNDKLEQGNVHNDKIKECQDSVTAWTPINTFKNTYPAISIFPGSHSFGVNLLFRLGKKFFKYMKPEDLMAIVGIKCLDLYPNISSSYIWHANLLHVGNLNSTENYHCALVIRITEKPLYYEPSVKCKDLVKRTTLEYIQFNLFELYKNLCTHTESIERISLKALDIEEFISNVYEYVRLIDVETRRALSFTLSLISQRNHDMTSSNYFDLASYIVGKENIVGLERYLNKCNDNKVALKVLNKISKYEKNDTYQEITLLNKFKQRFKGYKINSIRSSTVYSW